MLQRAATKLSLSRNGAVRFHSSTSTPEMINLIDLAGPTLLQRRVLFRCSCCCLDAFPSR